LVFRSFFAQDFSRFVIKHKVKIIISRFKNKKVIKINKRIQLYPVVSNPVLTLDSSMRMRVVQGGERICQYGYH
jgi:hypothetical protein